MDTAAHTQYAVSTLVGLFGCSEHVFKTHTICHLPAGIVAGIH